MVMNEGEMNDYNRFSKSFVDQKKILIANIRNYSRTNKVKI